MAKKRIPMLNTIGKEENTEYVVKERTNDFVVKDHLSFDEMMHFVDNVVTSCFDTKTGEYRPEVMDFAIRINTLRCYTDIELPTSMDEKYEMAVASGIVEEVLEYINRPQYLNMVSSIEAKVQNVADSHVHELLKRFDQVATSLESVMSGMESMFSGITTEDISKVMGAFSDSSGWEDKLIKAYSEQNSKKDE